MPPQFENHEDTLRDAVGQGFGDEPELTNPVRVLVEEHFGCSADKLAIVHDDYLPIVDVHLQNAVDKFVEAPGRETKLRGVTLPVTGTREYVPASQLMAAPTLSWPGPTLGSPDFVQQEISTGKRTVLRRGLFLTNDDQGPLAIWISQTYWARAVDVIGLSEERARAVVDELRASSYDLNPFQGQVITVTMNCPGDLMPVYLERPRDVAADEVVLPAGLLERIEEQAVGISAAKDQLAEAGHAMKRGILLHGRPGTGKTHTIRYLISRMPEHTVLMLPAGKMEMFTERMAEIVPYVTPGILIFDDVDLIAEDRSQWFTNTNGRGPLFSLLELMDGIGADADLLFILTTNVADRIEEAIAARPGRIDQAFEIPPPDGDCRRRLFELYAKDVQLAIEDMDTVIARTEGVTGSFLKELVRRAAVVAAMEGATVDDLVIDDARINKALDQLLDPDNGMTARLLGAQSDATKPTLGHVAARLQSRR